MQLWLFGVIESQLMSCFECSEIVVYTLQQCTCSNAEPHCSVRCSCASESRKRPPSAPRSDVRHRFHFLIRVQHQRIESQLITPRDLVRWYSISDPSRTSKLPPILLRRQIFTYLAIMSRNSTVRQAKTFAINDNRSTCFGCTGSTFDTQCCSSHRISFCLFWSLSTVELDYYCAHLPQ